MELKNEQGVLNQENLNMLIECAKYHDCGREKDGKFYSATGAKGYRWLESETVLENNLQDAIDEKHFIEMTDDAIETISKFGDFEWFVSDDEYVEPEYAIGEYGRYPIYK